MRVLITDKIRPPLDLEQRALGNVATAELFDEPPNQLDGRVANVDGLIICHEVTVTEKTIAAMDQCRVIVRAGVGVDNVDLDAARARQIAVCNIPDYGVDEVADHAIGLTIALNRGFFEIERRLRDTLKPWNRDAIHPTLRLSESTMGIIGCGRIGSATAQRARALKMKVLIYDPYLRPGMEKVVDATRVDLPTLLTTSDFVSVHTPLTDETRKIINDETIATMPSHAMLINTSRGGVVDVDAVADALQANRIGGAAIDVLPQEPPSSASKLIQLWQQQSANINLIITPHTAYYSESAIREIRTKGAEEVARVLRGEAPLNCVNPW